MSSLPCLEFSLPAEEKYETGFAPLVTALTALATGPSWNIGSS